MKLFSLALNGLKRDWHAGELRLIASAIVIAVASLTTVNFFTDRVDRPQNYGLHNSLPLIWYCFPVHRFTRVSLKKPGPED